MSKNTLWSSILALLTLFIAPIAEAHILYNEEHSWIAGFYHPLLGIDHILVMLATGLWAAQQGGNKLWQLPLVFLIVMAFGTTLGFNGFLLPMVRTGTISSVLLLGLLLALATRFSLLPTLLLTGLFALFHGYDHATEIPFGVNSIDYCIGFLTTTSLLLSAGAFLGVCSSVMNLDNVLRIIGIGIGVAGGLLWI